MSDFPARAVNDGPVGQPVRSVPAPFRTAEEIRGLLDRICGNLTAQDIVTTRRTLAILDDLAEEMIGRRGAADAVLAVEIGQHSARLRSWMPSR